MGLLNGLIAILVIKILFLKVDMWHVNAIPFPDSPLLLKPVQLKLERDDAIETFSNSNCSEIISRNVSQLVPYIETYRYRPEHSTDIYQIKSRLNYKKQFHTMWTCCEGYVQSGAMCVPRCPRSCEKGTCKEPDVCTCVDPEVCSCNEGYWMDSDGFTCRPVCNAECERNHGYCSEPNVCTCSYGYRRIGNDSSPFKECEPVCDHACNDHCVAPNVCMTCTNGYEIEYEPLHCKPKCDEPCVFGTCTAPRTCTCNDGYRAANASVCEPICSKPCTTSMCVAPDKCSCNEGYRHRNIGSTYICEPICETQCGVNGKCIAPGICRMCNTGFAYDQTNQMCKPKCELPCGPNGECTSPNKCTCVEGYRPRLLQKRYQEIPIYTIFDKIWKSHQEAACQPVCNFYCINGRCTAPNVCTCDPDYYPLWIEFHRPPDMKRVCTKRLGPPCNAFSCGDNAMCHAFGVCVCNDGYVKDTDGVCVPFCAQGCFNGMCTTPNRCVCHDGYALQNDSFCEPICERGCQNGDCVGPNRCLCHDDFIPNVDHHSRPECISVYTRNCSGHGDCVIDRDHDYRCECHFGWTGWDCDQPTVCVITMAYDHDDVNRITIRNDTNSTIMRAYENAPYCYQCDNSFDNETLCYVMQSDEGNTTNIGCLLSTDLPCYTTPHYNASIKDTIIVWPCVILAILLVTGLTVAIYLIYRKHQKKKSDIASTSTNVSLRESLATEFLLPDI